MSRFFTFLTFYYLKNAKISNEEQFKKDSSDAFPLFNNRYTQSDNAYSVVYLYTLWDKKIAPFYFCNNFVKPPYISIIFDKQILK